MKSPALRSGRRRISSVTFLLIILALGFASVLVVISPQQAHAEALNTWIATTVYPDGVSDQSCVTAVSWLYCIGGLNGGGNPGSVVYSGATSPVTGFVGGWDQRTSYPTNITNHSCVVSGDELFIYCVGGFTGSAVTNAVYYASILFGQVGVWTKTASYPIGARSMSCVASGGFIYCVGGTTGSGGDLSAVYYAPISSSGVGTWGSTTSYPFADFSHSCVSSGGFIYCVGSVETNAGNAVYYAPLSSSGVGTWTSTTVYPVPLFSQSCVASGGFIYCVGGATAGGMAVNAVYFAPLSSSGVGKWTSTTNYPTAVASLSCVTTLGNVYCIGGCCYINAVYYASISASSQTSQLTVNTQNTGGQTITGYYTVLNQSSNIIATGFSPATFALNNGQTYTVQVDNYQSCLFDHWSDTGSTSASRTISITTDTQLTAVYNCGGGGTTSTINVSTVDSAGAPIVGYYATVMQNGQISQSCFSPCSFTVNNGQAYVITSASFASESVSRWSDNAGTIYAWGGVYPITIASSSTTISLTAVYTP